MRRCKVNIYLLKFGKNFAPLLGVRMATDVQRQVKRCISSDLHNESVI